MLQNSLNKNEFITKRKQCRINQVSKPIPESGSYYMKSTVDKLRLITESSRSLGGALPLAQVLDPLEAIGSAILDLLQGSFSLGLFLGVTAFSLGLVSSSVFLHHPYPPLPPLICPAQCFTSHGKTCRLHLPSPPGNLRSDTNNPHKRVKKRIRSETDFTPWPSFFQNTNVWTEIFVRKKNHVFCWENLFVARNESTLDAGGESERMDFQYLMEGFQNIWTARGFPSYEAT